MDEERDKMDRLIELKENEIKLLNELVSLTRDMHKSSREMSIRLQEIKANTG